MSQSEVEAIEAVNEQGAAEKAAFQTLKRAVLLYFQMPTNGNGKHVTERMQAYQAAWMAGRVRP